MTESKEVALLGLLFIFRIRLTNTNFDRRCGSQWRIFVIALMIGHTSCSSKIKSLMIVLSDNTYTKKIWADVIKILHIADIKLLEIEFLFKVRFNLFVSSQQWEVWETTIAQLYLYHQESLRQQLMSNTIVKRSISSSPPIPVSAVSPLISKTQQSISLSSSHFGLPKKNSRVKSSLQCPPITAPFGNQMALQYRRRQSRKKPMAQYRQQHNQLQPSNTCVSGLDSLYILPCSEHLGSDGKEERTGEKPSKTQEAYSAYEPRTRGEAYVNRNKRKRVLFGDSGDDDV